MTARRPSRSRLALLVCVGVVAALLASTPAEAATKQYHASVGMTGLNAQHRQTEGRTITISGKVWGGPVKNQKVSIYVANLSNGQTTFGRRLAVVKIGAGNRYTYRYKTDDSGYLQLRVVKGAFTSGRTTYKAVKVTSRVFSIFRWSDAGLSPTIDGSTTPVGGQTHPGAVLLRAGDANAVTASFVDTCGGIRGKVGVADSAAGGGVLQTKNFELDDEPIDARSVPKGALLDFTFEGGYSFYPSLVAQFASPSEGDALVLLDVEGFCAKPEGYWTEEWQAF